MNAAKSLKVDDTYILGPLLILQHIFQRFGLQDILTQITKKHPRLEFEVLPGNEYLT